MTFKSGQLVLHVPSGKIVEVVRDEGGVKVVVKVDGVILSVLRKNLKEVKVGKDNRTRI